MMPRKISRYEIKSKIGRGGMANVYLAYDPLFKRDVAIKVLPRDLLYDPNFRARFEREAQAIASLEHPAIVPVYDYGEEDGQPFLVMRFMTGGSLADKIKNGPLSFQETAHIISQLAPALDEAHAMGIIHRDLKPDNILFDQRGNPTLSDFGIVKLAEATVNLTGTGIIGTPAYMSPEQVIGDRELDGRSDIYALGVILFQMLTGKLPYDANTPISLAFKHVNEPVPSVLNVNPSLPVIYDGVIERAMAKDPEERYPTASELATSLASITDDELTLVVTAHQIEEPHKVEALLIDTMPKVSGKMKLQPVDEPAMMEKQRALFRIGETLKRSQVLASVVVVFLVLIVIAVGSVKLLGIGSKAKLTSTAVASHIPTQLMEGEVLVTVTTDNLKSLATEISVATLTPTSREEPTATQRSASEWEIDKGLIAYVSGPEGAWQIFIADLVNEETWKLLGQLPNSGVPTWSPDGTQLAFRSNESGTWQIYIVNIDGTGLRQLTHGAYNNLEPAWSPEGTQIAFVSDREGDKEIYLIDIDGKNERRLTFNSGWDDDPSWSPDGRWLVFESYRSDRIDVYKMRTDGLSLVRLTSEGDFNGTPAWSPDGKRIAFERRYGTTYQIWIMDADGSNQQQLTYIEDLRPAWSSDGCEIAYTSKRDGEYAVWILEIDTGRSYRLSPFIGFDPAWSSP